MILASMPKHRGRKSKRELELMAAAEEARRAAEEQAANANNTDMQPEEGNEPMPEADAPEQNWDEYSNNGDYYDREDAQEDFVPAEK